MTLEREVSPDEWRAWSELELVRRLLCYFPTNPTYLAREKMWEAELERVRNEPS